MVEKTGSNTDKERRAIRNEEQEVNKRSKRSKRMDKTRREEERNLNKR